jgi:hypothetical protein
MEYVGTTVEVVASGIIAGINGSKTGTWTGTGSGAGTGFGTGFGLGFGFGLQSAAAKPSMQHTKNKIRATHNQLFMKEPEEPDCFHPELVAEPEESTEEDPSFRESDTKELDESPLLPEDESHGVTVVVVGACVTTTVMVVAECPVEASPNTIASTIACVGAMTS